MFLRKTKSLLSTTLPSELLVNSIRSRGGAAFFGVETAFRHSLSELVKQSSDVRHAFANDEAGAVAMATGDFLATGSVPCVYLSSSEIGKAVSPLLSLVHKDAEKVPLLLVIEWRGMEDAGDFPQHSVRGRLLQNMLTVMGIPFSTLFPSESIDFTLDMIVDKAFAHINEASAPYAIIVEPFTLEKTVSSQDVVGSSVSRRDIVSKVLKCLPSNTFLVAGPGGVSKDVAAIRPGHATDYLAIGGGKDTLSIAKGMALACSSKRFACLEAEAEPTTQNVLDTKNLHHILLYESKGASERSVNDVVDGELKSLMEGKKSVIRLPYIGKASDRQSDSLIVEYNAKNIIKSLRG